MAKKKQETEFIYCGTRNCPYEKCVRNIRYAPFNEMIKVVNYIIDKKKQCEGFLEG